MEDKLTMSDVLERLEYIVDAVNDIETSDTWYVLNSKESTLDLIRQLKRDILNSTLPF